MRDIPTKSQSFLRYKGSKMNVHFENYKPNNKS